MSIKITSVEADTKNKILYHDLALDLMENESPSRDTLYGKVTRTDLATLKDEGAIVNSINNIFNTTPGQKILSPEFGINLVGWLFEPVSEFRAREIGQVIIENIERYEPRVLVTNVTVLTDPENHAYQIKLSIQIPGLNITRQFSGALNGNGFELLTENE